MTKNDAQVRIRKLPTDEKITSFDCGDAVPFYLKNGFHPLNDDDKNDATRLLFFDLIYISDDL